MRKTIPGALLLAFCALCSLHACDSDDDECRTSCEEVYALAFDFENQCVQSNDADNCLGCIPYNTCDSDLMNARYCLISPERDAIVVAPNQIGPQVTPHLKEELGWESCRDVFEYVPEEFESMFPVCGEG